MLRVEAWSRSECFGGSAREQLLDLIERRQEELWAEAVPRGQRLYTEKPKRFLRRIEAYAAAADADADAHAAAAV